MHPPCCWRQAMLNLSFRQICYPGEKFVSFCATAPSRTRVTRLLLSFLPLGIPTNHESFNAVSKRLSPWLAHATTTFVVSPAIQCIANWFRRTDEWGCVQKRERCTRAGSVASAGSFLHVEWSMIHRLMKQCDRGCSWIKGLVVYSSCRRCRCENPEGETSER